MFKTSGAIDDRSFKKICFQTLPTSFFVVIIGFSIITVLMIIACIVEKDSSNTKTFLIALPVFWFLIIAKYHTYKNKVIDKMKSTGKSEIKFTSYFEDEQVFLINDSSGARTSVGYTVFVKYAESDELILLLTRRSQFVPVFKQRLKPGEKEQLLEFLKPRCRKIRRWGKN